MNNEGRAIAICKTSVLKNKNLKINKFTCKKKPQLFNLSKIKTNMFLNKTKKNK